MLILSIKQLVQFLCTVASRFEYQTPTKLRPRANSTRFPSKGDIVAVTSAGFVKANTSNYEQNDWCCNRRGPGSNPIYDYAQQSDYRL